MNATLFPILEIVKLNSGLLEKAIADLDQETAVRRVVEHGNPMLWVAGHLTAIRFSLAAMLGAKLASALGPVFARGAVVDDATDLPEVATVLSAWRQVSPVLVEALSAATETQLAAPSPRAFPIADKTVLGGICFLAYHEGYHLGQLALMRKALGLSRVVDG